jgi:hypothetical protein
MGDVENTKFIDTTLRHAQKPEKLRKIRIKRYPLTFDPLEQNRKPKKFIIPKYLDFSGPIPSKTSKTDSIPKPQILSDENPITNYEKIILKEKMEHETAWDNIFKWMTNKMKQRKNLDDQVLFEKIKLQRNRWLEHVRMLAQGVESYLSKENLDHLAKHPEDLKYGIHYKITSEMNAVSKSHHDLAQLISNFIINQARVTPINKHDVISVKDYSKSLGLTKEVQELIKKSPIFASSLFEKLLEDYQIRAGKNLINAHPWLHEVSFGSDDFNFSEILKNFNERKEEEEEEEEVVKKTTTKLPTEKKANEIIYDFQASMLAPEMDITNSNGTFGMITSMVRNRYSNETERKIIDGLGVANNEWKNFYLNKSPQTDEKMVIDESRIGGRTKNSEGEDKTIVELRAELALKKRESENTEIFIKKYQKNIQEKQEQLKLIEKDENELKKINQVIADSTQELNKKKIELEAFQDQIENLRNNINEATEHGIYGDRSISEWINSIGTGIISAVAVQGASFGNIYLQNKYGRMTKTEKAIQQDRIQELFEKKYPELENCNPEPELYITPSGDGKSLKNFELQFREGDFRIENEDILKRACGADEDWFKDNVCELTGERIRSLESNQDKTLTSEISIELVTKDRTKEIVTKTVNEWRQTLKDSTKKMGSFQCAEMLIANGVSLTMPNAKEKPEIYKGPVETHTTTPEEDYIEAGLNDQAGNLGSFFSWMTNSMRSIYNSTSETTVNSGKKMVQLAQQVLINTCSGLMRRDIAINTIVLTESGNLVTDYPDMNDVENLRSEQLRNIKKASFWFTQSIISSAVFGVYDSVNNSGLIFLKAGLHMARAYLGVRLSSKQSSLLWYGELITNTLGWLNIAKSAYKGYLWFLGNSGTVSKMLAPIIETTGVGSILGIIAANPVISAMGITAGLMMIGSYLINNRDVTNRITMTQVLCRWSGWSLNALYPASAATVALFSSSDLTAMSEFNAFRVMAGAALASVISLFATRGIH